MSGKTVLCFLALLVASSVLADDITDLPNCPEDLSQATYFADPEDCGGFYECSNSGPLHFICPEGTYYDTLTVGCVWAENVDCGTRPTTPSPTTVPTTPLDSADV